MVCATNHSCTNLRDVQGGFLPEMTRREAALVLGLRESASEDKVKDAHRRIMMINHPDAGMQQRLVLILGTNVL